MNTVLKTSAAAMLAAAALFTSCKSGDGKGNTAANGGAVELKFNLPEGSKYLYSTDIKQQTSTMGQSMTNNMLMEFTYDVKAAENNNKQLAVTYTRMKMDMNGMGQTMSYDSNDSAKANPNMKALNNMIGKSFTTTVAPNGSIVKVEGIEGLAPAGTPGMDAEAMKQMMQTSFNIFPDKPVKVGESWTKTSDMNMQMMKMKMDTKYTLKKVDGDKATIEMDGKISTGAGTEVQGMKLDLNGTQTGTMEVEIATGQAVSGDIKQIIKGKMQAGGQEIPMDVTSEIKITGKKM